MVGSRIALAAIVCALAAPALSQTLNNKDISADIAVIVGRVGEIIVQVRGDGTGPHTMENAFKKAFTARTFKIASGEMEKRLKDNPQMGAQFLTGFTTARGGLPIKIGEDVVGAAAVSGAPGGEKDEACVQTGLDKVRDQLK
jgi:uncharacterized protein GlcG (DUF336 family)